MAVACNWDCGCDDDDEALAIVDDGDKVADAVAGDIGDFVVDAVAAAAAAVAGGGGWVAVLAMCRDHLSADTIR